MKSEKNHLRQCLITIFSFAIMDVSFVEIMLVPLLQKSGLLPLMISVALISRKVTRMATDIPLAIIADKYGVKYIFLLARIARIIAAILLLSNNKICIVSSMIFYGISLSGFYGKVDTYLYNYLKIHHKTHLFPRIMSVYYGICQIAMMATAIVSGVIFMLGGYRMIIIATIAVTTCSIIPWCFIQNIKPSQQTSQSITSIISASISNLHHKPHLLKLIILFSTLYMLALQSGSFFQPSLLAAGLPETQLGVVLSVKALCMSLGSLVAFFIIRKTLSTVFVAYMFVIMSILMLVTGIIFSHKMIIIWLLCYAFVCTLMQVTIERNLEYYAHNNTRNTIAAFATFTASSLSVILTFLFGLAAQYYSPKAAYLLNAIIITAIGLWALIGIKNPHIDRL